MVDAVLPRPGHGAILIAGFAFGHQPADGAASECQQRNIQMCPPKSLMVFTLGAVGLPGTSGFVGELLVLVGAFQDNTWVAALAAIGVVLGAAYMLYLYRRVIFGRLTKDSLMATRLAANRKITFRAREVGRRRLPGAMRCGRRGVRCW